MATFTQSVETRANDRIEAQPSQRCERTRPWRGFHDGQLRTYHGGICTVPRAITHAGIIDKISERESQSIQAPGAHGKFDRPGGLHAPRCTRSTSIIAKYWMDKSALYSYQDNFAISCLSL